MKADMEALLSLLPAVNISNPKDKQNVPSATKFLLHYIKAVKLRRAFLIVLKGLLFGDFCHFLPFFGAPRIIHMYFKFSHSSAFFSFAFPTYDLIIIFLFLLIIIIFIKY